MSVACTETGRRCQTCGHAQEFHAEPTPKQTTRMDNRPSSSIHYCCVPSCSICGQFSHGSRLTCQTTPRSPNCNRKPQVGTKKIARNPGHAPTLQLAAQHHTHPAQKIERPNRPSTWVIGQSIENDDSLATRKTHLAVTMASRIAYTKGVSGRPILNADLVGRDDTTTTATATATATATPPNSIQCQCQCQCHPLSLRIQWEWRMACSSMPPQKIHPFIPSFLLGQQQQAHPPTATHWPFRQTFPHTGPWTGGHGDCRSYPCVPEVVNTSSAAA